MEMSIVSKFVMTTPTSRNVFRLWLNVQSKVLDPRLNIEEPYSEASYVKRPNHLRLQPELCQTSRIKMSDKHDENHSRAFPNMLNMSYNCAIQHIERS